MARVNGTFTSTSNYDVTVRRPFDARGLVDNYEDLTSELSWTVKGANVAYNGMLVAVGIDPDVNKRGLYIFYDHDKTGPFDLPDVTVETNWTKLCSLAELQAFSQRLTNIETDIEDLATRIGDLENRGSNVKTYGYRVNFPTEGEVDTLYVAVDEEKTYIYFNGEYLAVGGADSIEPDLIFGGTADSE